MDVETVAAIDSLENRIDHLGSRIDKLEAEMASRFDKVDAAFVETRRHSQVLSESVRDDIRLLAEGFAHLSTKIDTRR